LPTARVLARRATTFVPDLEVGRLAPPHLTIVMIVGAAHTMNRTAKFTPAYGSPDPSVLADIQQWPSNTPLNPHRRDQCIATPPPRSDEQRIWKISPRHPVAVASLLQFAAGMTGMPARKPTTSHRLPRAAMDTRRRTACAEAAAGRRRSAVAGPRRSARRRGDPS
jgi:hypothetical protein